MSRRNKTVLQSVTVLISIIISQIIVFGQIGAGGSGMEGSAVFAFVSPVKGGFSNAADQQKARVNKRRQLVSLKTNGVKAPISGTKGGGKTVDEPIAPPEWINEDADFAIEERKVADDEPLLFLSEGFLNSRINGCSAPVFPAAARKAKLKSVRLRLSITVAKYGGVLDAQVIEGDAIFRKAVYDSLGSMHFQQTFFMGEPVRIQAIVEFTQRDSDSSNMISCRDAVKEAELPAIIDGDVLNERATFCESPKFPTGGKNKGLKTVDANVEVIVGEDGKVINAKLVSGNPEFGDSAVKAAYKATFPKSSITNKLVKVRGILEFTQNPTNSIVCGKTVK